MVLNGDVFYYDYKDYQVSQIRDRTAVNENFNAKIWGAEAETLWQPLPDLRLNANIGYLNTSIGKGMKSIDIMNRTQSNPNYTLVKPWAQMPSNCIVPTPVAESWLQTHEHLLAYWSMCGGVGGILGFISQAYPTIDPATGQPYNPANYPQLNGGAGIEDDLSGKQLPNSPHFTFNMGAEYTLHWIKGWDTRVRGDFYHQSASFARVYNDDPYDRLRGWNNENVSLTFERVEDALSIEIYVKNLSNDTPITDAFLNSDDSALTTNVFTLDPRLVGFSITKPF
jgi:iron complex outermembrane recepter protein